jgi:hypothetical protein
MPLIAVVNCSLCGMQTIRNYINTGVACGQGISKGYDRIFAVGALYTLGISLPTEKEAADVRFLYAEVPRSMVNQTYVVRVKVRKSMQCRPS